MSNEEEKKCPLCAEEMDWTDQQLNPCKCGYEVCVWCWHHIMDMAEKDATEGRCPACRTPYDKDRIVGLEANFHRVAGNNSSRKQKLPKEKLKANEGRKDLSNVRVIQRKMAYIIGLPLDLADEDILQQRENFGQYGKVTKVSLSRTSGGTLQQFTNDTCSVYITYSKEEEAVTCIQAVHGYVLDGRLLRASFGTAKYCHAWLRNTLCNNPSCLYLHTLGADEDSFGKDEVAAVHTRNRVQEIVGATEYPHRRSGNMLPPPVVEQLDNQNAYEDPVYNDSPKEVAYTSPATNDDLPVKSSIQISTFVDIVGQSSNSSSVKDMNSVEEEGILNEFVNSPSFDDQILKNNNDNSWWHHNEEDNMNMISVLNDGLKFENSAKSDRIYRGSNSFSNEEIVEHLRRLDNDNDTLVDDDNDAAIESSIISNILSMDLDGDSSDTVTGFLESNGRHNYSWNYQNYNDQSRFSFAKETGFPVGQGLTFSVPKDSCENKDSFLKPQHHVASNVTPPGFSVPSKPPPPGFSAGPGNYASNNTKFFMPHHQKPQFYQTTMPQFPSSQDVLYGGLTSGVVDLHNQPSLFTQQPKFAGGVFQPQLTSQQQHGNGNISEVERFGFESLLPGGYMFQMPTSGDVYTRVFGM